jgi:spore maturation protein CgeB
LQRELIDKLKSEKSKLKLKDKIKQASFFYHANAKIKAHLQEQESAKEIAFYKRMLKKRGMVLPDKSVLSQYLADRLTKRDIHPCKKSKGDLHIFLTYQLNNWESVLLPALKPFGKVSEFEWRMHGFDIKSENWIEKRRNMNKTMLDYFHKVNSEEKVDIVVAYLSGYTCDPAILREMGQSGSIILNFCWDDKLGFRGKKIGDRWTGTAAIASAVDLNLTNAPESCNKYFAEGGLSMFWPEAAHPSIHKPYDIPFEFDVSVLGGNYGWRPDFVKSLHNMGIKVNCYGNGWPGGPLSNEESVKLYSKSRINLGFSGVGHSKNLLCLKGRDFEVPMSGGLYLTQHNPELSLVYEIGTDILTYKNELDCYQKIKWVLENPSTAALIRKNGMNRALHDHTWENRFTEVFSLIGMLNNSI